MSALTRLDELWEQVRDKDMYSQTRQMVFQLLGHRLAHTYPELRELVRAWDESFEKMLNFLCIENWTDADIEEFLEGPLPQIVDEIRERRATWESRLQEEIGGE